jgi:hypothetical protein
MTWWLFAIGTVLLIMGCIDYHMRREKEKEKEEAQRIISRQIKKDR